LLCGKLVDANDPARGGEAKMSRTEAAYRGDDRAPAALLPPGIPTPAIIEEQLQASRVAQANTAISDLVQAHGMATVGDLLVALGIESVTRLLAMLGFTGDPEGLAHEITPHIAQTSAAEINPVRDSA
jgi:hypothetical protein